MSAGGTGAESAHSHTTNPNVPRLIGTFQLCVCKVIVVICFLCCVCLLLGAFLCISFLYKVQFEHAPRKKRKNERRRTYVCGANPFFDLFVSLHF